MRFLALLLALALSCGIACAADVPQIAAAADLQFALQEIATAFGKETGQRVKLTFGSSGNFRRQIEEGAPFELFLSADEGYVRDLVAAGRTRDEGVVYAIGRLALVAPNGSPLVPDATFSGLRAALAQGRIERFAIANPEHAPYGRAAREALTRAGLWETIRPRLVLGENVAQAAQFAVSGGAQGGIISRAQAQAPALAAKTSFALVPADWHAPLRQRMVLLKGAGPTATAFYGYLQQAAARTVLSRAGFASPAP